MTMKVTLADRLRRLIVKPAVGDSKCKDSHNNVIKTLSNLALCRAAIHYDYEHALIESETAEMCIVRHTGGYWNTKPDRSLLVGRPVYGLRR